MAQTAIASLKIALQRSNGLLEHYTSSPLYLEFLSACVLDKTCLLPASPFPPIPIIAPFGTLSMIRSRRLFVTAFLKDAARENSDTGVSLISCLTSAFSNKINMASDSEGE
ncbi:hypothetical protein X474_19095 [Dethiosulfatarculus sandiegensis]|uniref:Uncharacterized protein n=1 Tax=Dethiosulfatarculus sandiegensis TaxID=1429043 RepID=A0A0D2JSH0_9BACT|nr:hypothetical protein X474_19095 [Dethiosulfatarculus sandiegensis]